MLQKIVPCYVARHFNRLPECFVKDVFDFEQGVRRVLRSNTSHVIIVPVRVGDKPTRQFIGQLQIALTRKTPRSLVFFVNGAASERQWSDCINDLAELTESLPASQFATIEYRSGSGGLSAIGAIRGAIADAVVLAGYNAGLQGLILTFNDIDTLAVSSDYYSEIESAFAEGCGVATSDTIMATRNPCVSEGYDFSVPELVILNALEGVVKRMAYAGAINFEQRLWLDAANMSIDGALYCEVGGFDYEATSGEDDRIGRAIHRYRPDYLSGEPITYDRLRWPGNSPRAKYLEGSYLVSDGRRALRALADGHRVDQAWSKVPFSETYGHELDSSSLAEEYNLTPTSLRRIILDSGDRGAEQCVAKIIDDLAKDFGRKDFRIRNASQLELFFDEVRSAAKNSPVEGRLEGAIGDEERICLEVVVKCLSSFGL